MNRDVTAEIIVMDKYKKIEKIIRERVGDKFAFAFFQGENCYTYKTDELTDIELIFIADTLNKRVK